MKNKFVDRLIFRNSLKRTTKSVFTWVWLSIIVVAIIPAAYLVTTPHSWCWGLILVFLLATTGIMVFNIVNLNMIYSIDYEMGIMNLEMRKGRSKAAMFFSRILANKIYTLSVAVITFIVLLIFSSLVHSNQVGNWPLLVFLIIPLDFILTRIYLFFFAIFKHKLAIGMSSLMIMVTFISPFTSMMIVTQNKAVNERSDVQEMTKSYLADSVLELYDDNQLKKFADDSSVWLNLTNVKEGPHYNQNMNFLGAGLVNLKDIKSIYTGDTLAYSDIDQLKNTLLYQLNVDENSEVAKVDSTAFNDSIYASGYTNAKKATTLKYLQNVIDYVNSRPEADKALKQFNQLIMQFAKFTIKAPDNSSSPEYLQVETLWGSEVYNVGRDATKKYVATSAKHTGIGLMTWNKIATSLIANVKTYVAPSVANTKAIQMGYSYGLPFLMTAQTIAIPNGAVNMLHYLRDANNESSSMPWLLYNNGSRWVDQNANEKEPSTEPMQVKKISNTKPVSKLYSVAGYELTLLCIGVGLVLIGYAIYFKRIKQ